jgi:hypothetical protein
MSLEDDAAKAAPLNLATEEPRMSTSKIELKALEYRARAEDASVAARACALDRAREQHELAALRWIALAEAEETRVLSNRARLAAVEPKPEGLHPESAT